MFANWMYMDKDAFCVNNPYLQHIPATPNRTMLTNQTLTPWSSYNFYAFTKNNYVPVPLITIKCMCPA